MSIFHRNFQVVVIGGGPGGIAPLLAAHRNGLLNALLSRGVAVVEQSEGIGAGTIGDHAINSDSSGFTFVDCLTSPVPTPLTALSDHPLTQAVAAAGHGSVPLTLAGEFLALVGATLRRMVEAHPGCVVLTGHRATAVQRIGEHWRITVEDAAGNQRVLLSQTVVSATGALQPKERLETETVGGVNLVQRAGSRLLQSGDVFAHGGLDRIADRLAGRVHPRVAIVGGSTSAAAVASGLLYRMPRVQFGPGGLTLLHRRPLRIFYLSAEDALAEGYDEFGPDDICPISKRVFRFAGFRLDLRELIMRARGIGGRPAEPRLALHQLRPVDPEAIEILDSADLVVAALGYRPRGIPVMDSDGTLIPLGPERGPQAALVDAHCRIVDADGIPLPGLFAIGLAAGFVPRGELGGEASFVGQANGLWLWQNDVGLIIAKAVLAHTPTLSPRPAWEAEIPLPVQIPPSRPVARSGALRELGGAG